MNRIIAIAALCLAFPAEALAESSTTSPDLSPELYEIEILIFQNSLSYLEGEELWTRDVVDTELPGIAEAVNIGGIPGPDSSLFKAAVTLDADGNYRVLAHRRWQQTADPRSEAKWVYITSLRTGAPELEGTLRFYQGRYLHVDIELLFREREVGSLSFVQSDYSIPKIYRISEHRRIRSRDVNYFDHPKFGALVKVTPVEKQDQE